MSTLIITSRLGRMMSRVPHRLLINGREIGIMNTQSVRINMPAGTYDVRLQSMLPFVYTTATITLHNGLDSHLDFSSRERLWDILFSIDLLLCIAKLIVDFPSPWNTIYEIATNGFFVVWLIYEWSIRKRYFRTTVYETLPQPRP